MALTSESMTPADIRACCGNDNNDFGGDGAWLILFILLATAGKHGHSYKHANIYRFFLHTFSPLLSLKVGTKPYTAYKIQDKQCKYHNKDNIMDAIVFVLVLKLYDSRMYNAYCKTYKKAKHQAWNQSNPSFIIHEVCGIVPGVSTNGLVHDVACDEFSNCRYYSADYKYCPGLLDLKQSEYAKYNEESDSINRKPRSK